MWVFMVMHIYACDVAAWTLLRIKLVPRPYIPIISKDEQGQASFHLNLCLFFCTLADIFTFVALMLHVWFPFVGFLFQCLSLSHVFGFYFSWNNMMNQCVNPFSVISRSFSWRVWRLKHIRDALIFHLLIIDHGLVFEHTTY